MREEDRKKLVDTIARKVMQAMRRQMAESSSSEHADVTGIHPPAGTCTGDYSKFKESNDKTTISTGSQVVPLSGIVTASQLQAAMDASPDGIAIIAPDARLTPLANDLLRQEPDRIRRADMVTATTGNPTTTFGRWVYWIDGKNAAAQVVVSKRRDRMQSLATTTHDSAIAQMVRELSDAISRKQATGGVLFVQNAAKAMCYVNRCANLRAVVGTCPEAVEQGIKQLGANVLVIEYPYHGPRAMENLVDRMMEQPPKVDAAVERELADLHRHG